MSAPWWLRAGRIAAWGAALVAAAMLSRSAPGSGGLPPLALAAGWGLLALLLFFRAIVAEQGAERTGSAWADLYWGLAAGAALTAVLSAVD